MKKVNVEVFSEESNFAVIKIPSRKYPGVLIQGDSLFGLLGTARDAIRLLESHNSEEAMEALQEIYDELDWHAKAYQEVMEENSIS